MNKLIFLFLLFVSNIDFAQNDNATENIASKIDILWDEGIKLNEEKNYQQAIVKYNEALKLWDDNFNEDLEYAFLLTNLGSSLYLLNRYDEALNNYLKSSQLIKELKGERNHDYINVLLAISNCLRETDKIEKSLDVYHYALMLRAEVNGNKNHFGVHALELSKIASEYKSLKLNKKAISAYKDALIAQVKWDKIDGLNYRKWFNELANLVKITQSYSDLIPFYLEQLEYKKETLGENNEKYLQILSNLIFVYTETGNIKDALPLSQQNVTLSKSFYGKDHFEFGRALEKLGLVYEKLGDLNKAKVHLENALKIKSIYKDEELDSYTYTLNHLALVENELFNYDRALELYNEALGLVKNSKGINSSEYLTLQNNIANIYSSKKEHKKAIDIYEQNLAIEETLFGKKHQKYAVTLNNLSMAYSNLGQYDKAIMYLEESLLTFSELLGEKSNTYLDVLSNLPTLYAKNKDYEKAIENFKKVVTNTFSKIDANFTFLSITQKEQYLNNNLHLDTLLDFINSINYETSYQYPELVNLALSTTINRKGLILSSSRKILFALQNHSQEFKKEVESYRELKMLIEKQEFLPEKFRSKTFNTSKDNLTMLQNKQNELYLDISTNQSFNIQDWKSILLDENDVAIEFDRFVFYKNLEEITGEVFYIAYVVKKGWESPKVVPLFEAKELEKLFETKNSINILYASRGSIGKKLNTLDYGAYDLIIKPLEDYLTNSSNLYFSPVGLLHKVPFAALQDKKGVLLSDKYDLNQVNSIISIKTITKNFNINNITLIGGVDYNQEENKNKELEFKFNYNSFFNTKRNNPLGTNWGFLEGTLDEVNKLSGKINNKKNIACNIITGEKATESYFKSLSGNSPSILHIATHGYFFDHEKSINKDEHNFKTFEDPLIRSGLILAGANYTWKNGGNPFFSEDGILTALEISNLDLSNTNMVVLSACETGLGDVSWSEGVYGLQRAFKMAGVDIIVMSLWEVPDKETAEFMQLFYSNWLEGQEVRKAFRYTQRTMSKKHKDNPEKWAAFVLIE